MLKNYNNTRHYKYTIILLIIFCSLHFNSCQTEYSFNENVVLEVNDTSLVLPEFRITYQSDPAFPGHKYGYEGLIEYAEKLIDQMIAHKLAREEKIFYKNPLKNQLDYVVKRETIRVFYKQEVADKIHISETELQSAYKKMSIRLRVKHLFVPTEEEANLLYSALQAGVSFDTLAEQVFKDVDPSIGGTDLGEVGWGDLEKNIEEAVFNLRPKQFSAPVKSRWGYHLLLVTERKENLLLTEDEFMNKRDLIYKKVKRRKEIEASGIYLKNYLEPLDIRVKANTFNKIIRVLRMHSDINEGKAMQRFLPLNDKDITDLETVLQDHLDDALVTSRHEIWSIKDFLVKLRQVPVEKRPSLSSPGQFKKDIGILIRSEFLFKKAKDEGIDKQSEVDSAVNEYAQKLAYEYYLNKIYTAYHPPEEVVKYYRREKGNYKDIESTILRGMTSLEHYKLYYASKQLSQYLRKKFPELKIRINYNLIQKESEIIKWNQPIRMFIPDN